MFDVEDKIKAKGKRRKAKVKNIKFQITNSKSLEEPVLVLVIVLVKSTLTICKDFGDFLPNTNTITTTNSWFWLFGHLVIGIWCLRFGIIDLAGGFKTLPYVR